MPRILVLADCNSELGDRPIMLEEELHPRAFADRKQALRVLERVGLAVYDASEVERRVRLLYAT
jgi:hypothetical protein